MKLTVVRCGCMNPEPHRKLQADDGRTTPGFFSIAVGKKFHNKLLVSGEIEQTKEEKAATEQELASCGLPAEGSPSLLEPGSVLRRPALSEDSLKKLATELMNFPAAEHQEMVSAAIMGKALTLEEGAKILAMVAVIN